MMTDHWFDDIPVIGKMPRGDAVARLRSVGEEIAAAEISADKAAGVDTFGIRDLFRGERAYLHTSHAFGFIHPRSDEEMVSIHSVGDIEPDSSLRNSRVSITLDGLSAVDYPGSGEHRILFDFFAQNHLEDTTEDIHFNSTYRVREGERAAVLGFPIFIGLNVGPQGVSLKCFTINVHNTDDEKFLAIVEGDAFRRGLALSTVVQPALVPLTGFAMALTRTIATRNRNIPVQDFFLGLDFSNVATRGRLREGSYIAVQVPEALSVVFNWDDWVYRSSSGQITRKDDETARIPFNYVVLGVSRFLAGR